MVRAIALLVVLGACGASDVRLAVVDGRTSLGLELVEFSPGELDMGSTDGEANEQPVHRVHITRAFAIGRHEVTGEEFEAFALESGYTTDAERLGAAKVWNGSDWELRPGATFRTIDPGSDKPVVGVSWNDARAFTAWLTERERDAGLLADGEVYRLPTEAEWEYAARAGTSEVYAGASDPEDVCEIGNVPDEAAADDGLGREVFPCDDDHGIGVAAVESYRPNRAGLFDMSGNVWEWVLDAMAPYSSGPVDDPRVDEGATRVMRGGSWSGKLGGPRVAHRDGYEPTLAGGAIGFRIVRGAP